eukprot:CAMPEP_0119572276 /NCGR_PEP_ID=MMETSP1352-20130426/44542_1 /TAXON_ID=265584 /ORGANISM="Stauroneis constricta, Strain CCMP1120" /LENGTH=622 /DNA_ID=CAMNT_0007621961 /DNA_START=43 /DNA_END=1911 /DNA_ORIENTATION=+
MANDDGSAFSETIRGDGSYFRAFDPPSAVDNFHDGPRFGHTNDLSHVTILKGDSEDPDDSDAGEYAMGLAGIAIIISALLLTWAIALIVFATCARPCMGWLAGKPFLDGRSVKAKVVRVMFGFSCIMLFIFAILLSTQGTSEFRTTFDHLDDANTEFGNIVDILQRSLSVLDVTGKQAVDLRDDISLFLSKDICPDGQGSTLEKELESITDEIRIVLDNLDDFNLGDVGNLDSVLDDLSTVQRDIGDGLDEASDDKGAWALLALPYWIVAIFLCSALLIVWIEIPPIGGLFKCFMYFINCAIMQLLITFIIIAVIICCIVSVTLSANADFCSGGDEGTPEGTIDFILDDHLASDLSDSDEMEIFQFYLHQCQNPDNPLAYLDSYVTDLDDGVAAMDAFMSFAEIYSVDSVTAACGTENYASLVSDVEIFHGQLLELRSSTDETIESIGCARIVPIYHSIMYDSACDGLIMVQTWTFVCTLMLAIFGMLILTFRAAIRPITSLPSMADDDDKSQDEEGNFAETVAVPYEMAAADASKNDHGQVEDKNETGPDDTSYEEIENDGNRMGIIRDDHDVVTDGGADGGCEIVESSGHVTTDLHNLQIIPSDNWNAREDENRDHLNLN